MDMTTRDEELQNKILSGLADDSNDGITYKKVINALSTEPDFHLPINFVDNVLRQIEVKEQKSTSHEMYWLIAGIVVLSVGAIIGALLSGFKPSFGAFKFWASYQGLFAFGLAFLLLLQWIDKKLVRPKTTL
jgi:hypothetical protein